MPNNSYLRKLIQGPLQHKEEQQIVSSILTNHSWYLDRLLLTLHRDAVDQIKNIYIPFSTKPDHSFRNQTPLDNFTTKSAYLFQLQVTNQIAQLNAANNSCLRQLKCLNKLKKFMCFLYTTNYPLKTSCSKEIYTPNKPLPIQPKCSRGHIPHILLMQKVLPLMELVQSTKTSTTQLWPLDKGYVSQRHYHPHNKYLLKIF